MPDTVVGDIWSVSTRSSYLGQPVVNAVHLVVTETPLGVSQRQLGTDLVTFLTPLTNLVKAAASSSMLVQEQSAQFVKGPSTPWPPIAHQTFRANFNEAGDRVGDLFPGQPSFTITTYGELADGKGIRGGVRLAGIVDPDVVDGLLTDTFMSDVSAEINLCFLQEWTALTGTVTLFPIILSMTYWKAGIHSPYFSAVEQAQPRFTPGTIRRRKQFSSTGGYSY